MFIIIQDGFLIEKVYSDSEREIAENDVVILNGFYKGVSTFKLIKMANKVYSEFEKEINSTTRPKEELIERAREA